MKEALKALWENRTQRDRTAIGAAAILIALAIAYAYVWLPVTRERDRLLARLPELRAQAEGMARDVRELEHLRGSRGAAPPELKGAIEQAVAASGIATGPGAITQQNTHEVRISLPSVPAAVAWPLIARLQAERGVRLQSARLTTLGGERLNLEAVLVSSR